MKTAWHLMLAVSASFYLGFMAGRNPPWDGVNEFNFRIQQGITSNPHYFIVGSNAKPDGCISTFSSSGVTAVRYPTDEQAEKMATRIKEFISNNYHAR